MGKRESYLIWGLMLIFWLSMVVGWTYTLDCDSPLGTDAPSTIDDKIRETRDGYQERLNVDHYFALTGSSLSDSAIGQHRQIEFYGPISTPSDAANKSWLYSKDVSSKTEFHWLDEDGNELQITNAGTLNISSDDLLGTLTNETYFTAVNAAGDGTVDLIKANSSDVAVLPDGSEMASTTAPTADADISNKKYVDDQCDAHVGTAGQCHADGTTVHNGTLTANNTFQDLDLSSYVGSNIAFVYLEVYNASGFGQNFCCKPKGYGGTGAYHITTESSAQVSWATATCYGYATVMTDTSGVIQIAVADATQTIRIKLVGYVK